MSQVKSEPQKKSDWVYYFEVINTQNEETNTQANSSSIKYTATIHLKRATRADWVDICNSYKYDSLIKKYAVTRNMLDDFELEGLKDIKLINNNEFSLKATEVPGKNIFETSDSGMKQIRNELVPAADRFIYPKKHFSHFVSHIIK